MVNDKKLFYASCFALITTAFSFAFNTGVMEAMQAQLGLDETQLGFLKSMWFWGFPVSMIIGGLIYRSVGGARIMQFAFIAHTVGIILILVTGSYALLLLSWFLIGLGNGCTEAACNPMIADAYEGNTMSKMMNRFHMWFPGGLLLGSLINEAATRMEIGWKVQVGIILIPTVIYAILFLGEKWPEAKTREEADLGSNFKAMLSPLFIFMLLCMGLTAISEFGPNAWVPETLKGTGASPMLVFGLTFGVMAVARYFGGAVVAQFNTTGVLWGSAILASIGLFMLANTSGISTYFAAAIFGLGIAYFWPNMIGFIAEYIPKSGAIGLSIVGAMGMFMVGVIQPIYGGLIEQNQAEAIALGTPEEKISSVVGQMTLGTMTIPTLLLIGLFGILFFWVRNRQPEAAAAH